MIAAVIAVYAWIAYEAWSLSRPPRGRLRGRAPDLGALEVTPVPPVARLGLTDLGASADPARPRVS